MIHTNILKVNFNIALIIGFQDLNPGEPGSEEAALALAAITYVGLIISLVCLVTFIVTYLSSRYVNISGVTYSSMNEALRGTYYSRKLHGSIHGQILINLSIALMGLYIIFLIGGHVTSIPVLCGMSAALLHYFMLVFFGWTAAEAIYLYIKLVMVFGTQTLESKFTLKAGLVTWCKFVLVSHLSEPIAAC